MKLTHKLLLAALLAPSIANATSSFDYIDVNRFVGVKVNKNEQQNDPLNTVIKITVPESISTVGQAINFILEDSGYTLSPVTEMQNETKTLLSRPLPRIHRNFQLLTLRTILKTCAGDSYLLMVEPVKREINFLFSVNGG